MQFNGLHFTVRWLSQNCLHSHASFFSRLHRYCPIHQTDCFLLIDGAAGVEAIFYEDGGKLQRLVTHLQMLTNLKNMKAFFYSAHSLRKR